MKHLKRVVLLLFCVVILCVLLPRLATTVNAEVYSGNCSNNYNNDDVHWSLDTDTGVMTIYGSGDMKDGFHDSFYPMWYQYRSSIKTVIIEYGVTLIGYRAFINCSNLKEVVIPGSVTRIGVSAFENCSSLSSIVIPEGTHTLSNSAFKGCNLQSISLPASISLVNYAFTNCSISDVYYNFSQERWNRLDKTYAAPLASATVHFSTDNAVDYGEVVSDDGYKVGWMLSTDGTLSILSGGLMKDFSNTGTPDAPWYQYNTAIRSVVVYEGVRSIGKAAFFNFYPNLSSVKLSPSVYTIGVDAFYGCRALSEIVIPSGVNVIYESAFSWCTGLKAITLPKNLQMIGDYAFNNTAIEDVYYPGENFSKITIGTDNDSLTSAARIHFGTTGAEGHVQYNACTAMYSCSCNFTWDSGNQALGHVWGNWEETKAVTCTENGEQKHVCSRCSTEETSEIPALGHDYIDHAAQAATCTEIGWDAYQTCSRCDYTSYVEIPALGHDLTELDREDATCTEAGEVFYRCSRCRRYITEELPALGHDFGDWAVSVDPTCTEEGEECRSCSHCTEVESRTIEALGHNYQSVVTAPTCTAGGFTTYTCSRCNDSYVADTVEALGHTPGEALEENRAEPSCTEVGGYDTVTVCTVCGTELSNVHTELAALGHDWSEWQCTAAPTCTADGEETRSCSRCSEAEVRPVDALGHDYEAAVTQPTCTTGGFTTYTCSRCNDSYVSDQVDALGHDYIITVMRDAIAAKTGRMGVSCSRCDFDEFVVLPKLSEEDYTLSNNTATCTEVGTATYTWNDTTYGVYSVEGPTTALGHELVYTALDAEQHQITCTRCDYSQTEAHSFDETGACVCGMQENGTVSDSALKIKFASLTLKSDLAINFYVANDLLAQYSDPYVMFTKALYDAQGNITGYEETTVAEHPLTGNAGDGSPCQGFAFTGVNAKEIGSAVTATLYGTKDGQLCKGPTVNYSAKQYAMNQLARTSDAKLKTLLVDLLNYGALAQTYWSYNTANLANASLTAEQQAFATQENPTLTSCRELIKNDGATVSFKSVSLSLRERVTVNYYLNLTNYSGEVSDLEARITYTDTDGNEKTIVIDSADFVQKQHTDGNMYTAVEFSGLNARQMRTACTCELFSKTSGERVSNTVIYSVASYAQTMSTASDSNLVNLIYAMMKYGDATAEYFK